MTEDCEVIRPTKDGEDCWIPEGTIPVVEEREEG
jgi:hypothetical protein